VTVVIIDKNGATIHAALGDVKGHQEQFQEQAAWHAECSLMRVCASLPIGLWG
jgi:hypothetical protein